VGFDDEGQAQEIWWQDSGAGFRPMMQVPQRKQYDLADLVKRITRGGIGHKEVDFGRAGWQRSVL